MLWPVTRIVRWIIWNVKRNNKEDKVPWRSDQKVKEGKLKKSCPFIPRIFKVSCVFSVFPWIVMMIIAFTAGSFYLSLVCIMPRKFYDPMIWVLSHGYSHECSLRNISSTRHQMVQAERCSKTFCDGVNDFDYDWVIYPRLNRKMCASHRPNCTYLSRARKGSVKSALCTPVNR